MCKKGVLLSLIITLALSIMLPFSISADQSLPAPFIGINLKLYDYERYATGYHIPVVQYIPSTLSSPIAGQLNCTSPSTPTTSNPCDVFQLQSSSGSSTGLTLRFPTFTASTNDSNANVFSGANYVWEYEFVFDNYYVGYFTFTYIYSDTTYSKTLYVNGSSVSYTYINNVSEDQADLSITITDLELNRNKMDSWNFPIESFSAVNYLYSSYDIYGLRKTSDLYTFPIFYITGSTGYACRVNKTKSSDPGIFVFAIDKDLTVSNFFDYFYFQQENATLISIDTLQPYGSGWGIYKIKFVNPNANVTLRTKADIYLMPIYSGLSSNHALSSDFALQFGLTNDYLDALVYGTDSTNLSSNSLDNSSSNMNTQMNDLVGIEDGYNQQFNNSLNQIDFTSPTGNQNLLSSANFVITVFNGLIQNNFLSTLIIIICILIIGKKVIGK